MRKSTRMRREEEFAVLRPAKQPRLVSPYEGEEVGGEASRERSEVTAIAAAPEEIEEVEDSGRTANGKSGEGAPINRVGLKGLVLCVTGMDLKERKELRAEIERRGGAWSDTLVGSRVTHLVADVVGSAKYTGAVEHEIPIVRREFAAACLSAGRVVDFRDFALPCFAGLLISLSGFQNEKRAQLRETIERNGGCYEGSMTMGVTTHLVAARASGEKFISAKEWGIPVVSEEWLQKCVELGAWVSETPFVMRGGATGDAATTPVVPTLPIGKNENVSLSSSHDANKDAILSLSAVIESRPPMRPSSSTSTSSIDLPPPPPLVMDTTVSSSKNGEEAPSEKPTTTTRADSDSAATTTTRRLEEDDSRLSRGRRPHAALRDCVLYIEAPPVEDLTEEARARLRYVRTSALHSDAQILWEYDPAAVTHVVVGLDSQAADTERLKEIRSRAGGPLIVRPQFVVECALKGRMVRHPRFLWTPPAPPPAPALLKSRSNSTTPLMGAPILSATRPVVPRFTNIRGKLVCVSRYVEPERGEVQRLCEKLGASFTDRFTRKDPIVELLISKEPTGPKYEAALKWGTPVATIEYLRELMTTATSSFS